MIGNDIVDLALAKKESNWKRKGYLNKIFTNNEQSLILNADNPSIMVWNIWSRKEAAYKIYNRQTQVRGYFPLAFECFNLEKVDNYIFGKVVKKDQIYFTKTELNPDFLYTIATINVKDFDSIFTLNDRKNIFKISGFPTYYDADRKFEKPASISNHGRFERIISV